MYTAHATQATMPYTVQRTHTRTHGERYNARAAHADRRTHTHIHKIHCSHCPSRTPYRTYTRKNVAHKPSTNSGRTPRPVGSTQPCPGPVRVLYTRVPHSHAQTNTHVRSCPGPVRLLYTCVTHLHAQIHAHVRSFVQGRRNPRAVRSPMGTTSDTRGTARTLSANTAPSSDRDRSRGPDHTGLMRAPHVQIPPAREVVADLVIGYDLAMAQNQPKFTVDWFTHKMSATHPPAAAASKKRAMQELKDQRALGGKDSYHSISAYNRPPPHLRGTAPLTNPAGAPAYSPPRHAGWGGGQPNVCTLHQRGQASQSSFHSVPFHHVPQVRSTRTYPAPLPQLESIGRRQRQYRDERKVPVSTDHFRLDLQRHGC